MCKQYNLMCPCQQQHYPYLIYLYNKKLANILKFKKNDIFYMQDNYVLNFKLKLLKTKYKFFCINNATNKNKKEIIYYLKILFPNKPFFEK